MRKLKADIIASFKNKRINVFILFLLSAFVILIFTKLSKYYTNTLPFEIEKLNVPQENVILNDSVKLNITLKTHGFNWLKYYMSKPKIKIDFSKDVYKKEGVFVWNKSKSYLNNTQFEKQVELLSISPDPVTFRYGVNMVKKVPVVLNTKLSFSPGFDMSNDVFSEPDSIIVVGPNILVSQITALEAEPIILNDIRANISETVKLKLPKNASDLKFSSKQIILKGQVEKFTEGTLKVPVFIINAPKNTKLKYFPKVVSVSYYVSLTNFNTISVKDFKVVCDFNKINESQSFFVPELIKSPEAVKNAKIKQQRIEFILTK
ncbi:MAG: YbbR-like domain-containing protein [Algibacter sp.]|uniref:CdaR family protein n=1 Tax=Algibacter sp. TaxID=1872428 RepID=UPI0026355EF9|nr:YbbR-like domain-containing protein [Algibacter sp.]MDG1729088.1 YbbR-like domain-containing protein [Algibacter sp.]MDG2179664.1 YbbR-like domain-containing protein [Algibacter sp.]